MNEPTTAQELLDYVSPMLRHGILSELEHSEDLPQDLAALLPAKSEVEVMVDSVVSKFLQERQDRQRPNPLIARRTA